MSFRERLANFFNNRYGNDQLNVALLVVYAVLALINIIHPTAAVSIIMILLLGLIFVRMLSKNLFRRRRENAVFMKFWRPTGAWLRLQRDRIRDRKTRVYRKCPTCKAVVRLPRKPGVHTVVCPKCSNRFKVSIK